MDENETTTEIDILSPQDTGVVEALLRAEIDTQVATARRYPRSINLAIRNILNLATLDEATAEECIYALNRSGKPIRGASIRLAEIIASQWGNCRDFAQIVRIDRENKMIVAEGTFIDLETNRGSRSSVMRRISTSKGSLFSDDMIAITGNAACSIARRNAILGGVPKAVWRQAYASAEQIIRGDSKTLVERRDAAVKAFAHFGLVPDQVFKIMEVPGVEDIGLDDLVTLRGIYSSLRNGEATVEELLRGRSVTAPHRVVENPLGSVKSQEAPAEPGQAAGGSGPATSGPAEPADPSTDPHLAKVRQAGRTARENGMTRKALPAELRASDRKAEADAWLEGYESTTSRVEQAKRKD